MCGSVQDRACTVLPVGACADRSVDAASWNHPLRLLARHARDQLEVGVVVQHGETRVLGGRGLICSINA